MLRALNGTSPVKQAAMYAFGSFRLDTGRRIVLRAEQIIPLSEKLYRILLLLVEANGLVVSKNQFLSVVWPEGKALENNLTQHVYNLRTAMGADLTGGSPILTVAGAGYRLGLPVTELAGSIDDGEEGAAIGRLRRPINAEAFFHYCRASMELELQTPSGLRHAADFFRRALQCDPAFGDAHLGMARVNWLRGDLLLSHPRRAFARADRDIDLALDSGLPPASAFAMRAAVTLYRDWNRAEAALLIDKALSANPSSALAYCISALIHASAGSYAEAVSEAQHALELTPAPLALSLFLARILLQAGNHQAAIAGLSAILEVNPDYVMAAWLRAQAYILAGDPESALEDLAAVPAKQLDETSFRFPLLGRAYGDVGETELALSILNKLEALASTEYVSHWNRAIVSISVGNRELTLQHIAASIRDREPPALFLGKSRAWFNSLTVTNEFAALVHSAQGR